MDKLELTSAERDALRLLIARAEIARVAQDWGLARDAGRWNELQALFTPDAVMHTTWFVGSASEFIERSREAAKAGARVQHFIGTSSIEIHGDRAIAETRMILTVRGKLQGLEVDVTCQGRFYDFLSNANGWRIQRRVPIYERDRMDPLAPGAVLDLDPERLARYPEGYRHLAYLQTTGGARIGTDLPTPHSDALARLCAEGSAWLGGDAGAAG
ncbi:nuclear transport factor 2 family protein [Variovorax sp. J22P271]|uniref:nuclear transport factor 2 family protein n=1 Tax=Variovorax davisae TaxID=3053515 RepID=UPI002575ED8F|nr:nuclear transport factor 2 family protein [Variovorax sp. J22P271]MDM0036864.1 nuclear transport factor 2 family protein [Variovorax sp. J22P271]